MFKKLMVFMLLFSGILLYCKKIASFQDYFKTPAVLMDKDHLCIWDQTLRKIRIYSRHDLIKISEFGNKGQGPGEFIGINNVSLCDDLVLVSSYPKLCFFTKKGKLVKELKGPTDAGSFIPFGKNFIGISYPYTKPKEKVKKILFSLFNSSLKKKKYIYFAEYSSFFLPGEKKEIVYWIRDCTKAFVYDDILYIGSTYKGFYFIVFDIDGNKLFEINKKLVKRKVTNEDKNRKIDEAKKNWGESRWKQFISMYEIRMPEFYPSFANYSIYNKKIYVFLYPGEKFQEIIILDLKGNILDKKEIPFLKTPGCIEAGRFSINSGRLYYMVENEETDNWELHMVGIEN